MRWLLALFFALATQGHSACASGTVALFPLNGSLEEVCNGYDATAVGTVTYDGAACYDSGIMMGIVNNTKYATSAAARAAMSGATTWTVEGDIYFDSLAPTNQIFLSVYNGVDLSPGFVLNVRSTGVLNVTTNDANVYNSAAGVATTGSCQYFQIVMDGANLKMYYGTRAGLTKVFDDTIVGGAFPNVGNFFIGIYGRVTSFSALYNGYLSNVRLSNVARNGTPTIDPGGSLNIPTSPYPWQRLTPRITPKLGMWLGALFAPGLIQAGILDWRQEQRKERVAKKIDVKSYTAKAVLSGKITRTATPTRTPTPNRSRTETATPTASPTVTETPNKKATKETDDIGGLREN